MSSYDENIVIVENDGRYHHFGMIEKYKEILHLVYRTGITHYREGRIFYRKSANEGRSWSDAIELSESTLNPLVDYRGVSIGLTNDGRLVVIYVKKEIIDISKPKNLKTSWKYKFSEDNGDTWSEELTLDDTIENGLPYGHPFVVSGTSNEIVCSGYCKIDNNYCLVNFKGQFDEYDNNIVMNWTQLPPTIYTTNNRYEYSEHCIVPIDENYWIAVSRGEESLNIFKTLDGGTTWFPPDPLMDIAKENAYSLLVAPTIYVFSVRSEEYLLLLYTERFNNNEKAIAYYRIGKGIHDEQLTWSQPIPICEYINRLSGYQSGVFLDNKNLQFYHISFNEKNEERSRADIEAIIIDLSTFDFKQLSLYSEVRSLRNEIEILKNQVDRMSRILEKILYQTNSEEVLL
eukprot:TRINITY_DN8811_c0_g1_i1.p1 TRINITY_DN8811_c0_g1~~TRINITY_DN8811_c0_g1_i1.p1  ORF type:complete len:402 (+),score=48.89 TRINITY_DN8811_c0_g1_i1:78-1283(+)